MTVYAAPGAAGAKIAYKPQYNNFIGGQFVPPVKGQYFDVVSPVNGKVYTQAARSTAEDIELALDAAHAAADAWGKTDAATRGNILLKIADRIEQNLELLAYAETVDNGKAIRETLNADIPLTVDHFRYFAFLSTTGPAMPLLVQDEQPHRTKRTQPPHAAQNGAPGPPRPPGSCLRSGRRAH